MPAHLPACLPRAPGLVWENVLNGLRTGEPGLSQLTATPLGLRLLRAAYIDPHADPASLTGRLGQVMDFLDDAHRLGLLRVVGPVYRFRHADLQDHLAAGTRVTARPRQGT
ncbi:hypothetical protein [Microbispora sp. NBC_01389]|uniref:hypothetical protein n=1 Tax=Microbispora sp. NBC_01389 TaxID=2903584 RepID=UPI0032537160